MEDAIREILDIPVDRWLSIFGLIGTTVFGILSLLLYRWSKRVKKLRFVYHPLRLQTTNHPNIRILFDQKPIQSLIALRVAFVNNGNEVIKWADIPPKFPPSIRLIDAEVLSIRLVTQAKPQNSMEVNYRSSKDDPHVEIRFDYLAPGDGGVIEILYDDRQTTRSPFENRPKFKVSVIGGAPTEVNTSFVMGRGSISSFYRSLVMGATCGLLAVIGAGVVAMLTTIRPPNIKWDMVSMFGAILAPIIYFIYKSAPHVLVPSERLRNALYGEFQSDKDSQD